MPVHRQKKHMTPNTPSGAPGADSPSVVILRNSNQSIIVYHRFSMQSPSERNLFSPRLSLIEGV
jgi:hypothetical protein